MKQKDVISSLSNSRVKNLCLLQRKAKSREEQGLFVVEGPKMLMEAQELGILCNTYVSESFYQDKLKEDPLYFEGLDYDILTDGVFKEVSDTKTPQGILGTVKRADYELEHLLSAPRPLLLLLENIQDPGNLGTMIRTAEGAGVTGVICSNTTVDLYNPKVVRSTMGSIFRVPFYQSSDFIDTLHRVKERGITIYAAHLSGNTYDMEEGFYQKCAFLIGNEANGLSEEASKQADRLIKIPMEGKVESLNAAVAAAILMYEAARQRRR